MPRPVDPKFGQDGYEFEIELEPVKKHDLDKVHAVLDRYPRRSYQLFLRRRLSEVKEMHWRWKDRGAEAFTRGEAGKALRIIAKTTPITRDAISSLNERAVQLVLDELLQMKLTSVEPGQVWWSLYSGELAGAYVEAAVHKAIATLNKQKGPDKPVSLAICVSRLLWVYECILREPATFSCNRGRLYSRMPVSKAARFVLACYEIIDPKIENFTLNNLVREAMHNSEYARRKRRRLARLGLSKLS